MDLERKLAILRIDLLQIAESHARLAQLVQQLASSCIDTQRQVDRLEEQVKAWLPTVIN